MNNRKKLAVAVALATATSSISTYAAQALEEIIVTAQKREQSLQDVPVAVTAFSQETLREAGIQTISDLERIAPNTQLRSSRATNSTLTAYIRGIGQNDPLWGFEPGVGLYIDDVYFARPQGAMLDVYDIERIEILRGPQGSLYGKNTIGGAIKYVTKRMGGEPELKLGIGAGSYNQRDIVISGQQAIIDDKLFIGAAIATFNRDGFGKNNYTGAENYDKDVSAYRLSFEYSPSETVFMRLAGDKTIDDSNNRHGSRLTTSAQTGELPQDTYDTTAGAGDDQRVENSGVNFTVEWDYSDAITFKSVSAYREGSTDGFIDFDSTEVATFDAPVAYADHQFTQEFQINYSDDKLAVVGGIYYLDGSAAGGFDVVASAALGAPALEPKDLLPGTFVAATQGSAETTSKAIYIHGAYDVTENLTFTLGGRYTRDKKQAVVYKEKFFTDGSAGGASELFGGVNIASLVVQSDFTEGDEWSEFSPSIGADYQLDESTMIYASYAEGFKSGGVNMRGDDVASPAGFSHVFDPESAKSFELGIKTELLDSRVRINAAVFHSKYDNVQITQTVLIGTDFVPSVASDNEQSINGLEFELAAQLSDKLTANFNLGYIDSKWDKFTDGFGVDVGSDMSIANVPELSAYIGFNYELDLGNSGSIIIGPNVSYTDDIAMEVAFGDQPIDEDSYTLLNLDITWYSTDEHWSAAIHAKNLTDKEYRVAGYNFPNFLGDDEILGFYGDPRTVVLNVNYSF